MISTKLDWGNITIRCFMVIMSQSWSLLSSFYVIMIINITRFFWSSSSPISRHCHQHHHLIGLKTFWLLMTLATEKLAQWLLLEGLSTATRLGMIIITTMMMMMMSHYHNHCHQDHTVVINDDSSLIILRYQKKNILESLLWGNSKSPVSYKI